MQLTKTDIHAIESCDEDYLLNKGAKYYEKEQYEEALDYYRLAASLGSYQAIANIGYCYLYATGIPKNEDMAFAYFLIAANRDNIDAFYQLGHMYQNKDEELSLYYYEKALQLVEQEDNPMLNIQYPNVYLRMAKVYMPGGQKCTDLFLAYHYLKKAEIGYEFLIEEGQKYYQESLEEVKELLEEDTFESIREMDLEDSEECDLECHCGCEH